MNSTIPNHLKTAVQLLDQIDAITRLEAITRDCDKLESALRANGRTFPARPAEDPQDILSSLEQIEQHHGRVAALAKCAGVKVSAGGVGQNNPVARAAKEAWKPTEEKPKAQTATDVCRATVANARAAQKSQATARYNAAVAPK